MIQSSFWSVLAMGGSRPKLVGVESRSGAVAWGREAIAPFPLPAHRTGRADFPHPALRPTSPQGTRRWPREALAHSFRTPSSSKTVAVENRLVPRDGTL